MFSSRLPGRLAPNALSRAVEAGRRAGRILLDLTATNPTSAGLSYPSGMLAALSDPRAVRYEPDPRGLRVAREAVAGEYARTGTPVDPDRLVLVAGTSDAYSALFKLMCDPGQVVLVPQPSYPLFEWLARLDGVQARPYRLEYHGVWSIDRASLEAALTPEVRAVLVVTPNNPTGSMLRADDRDWLADLAAVRGLALISDEVFSDYPLAPRPDARSLIDERRALTFVLGGLSKAIGLPQVKLAWVLAAGPDRMVADALERLDVIADTYLSVSTPVQWAAPRLLAAGTAVRAAIHERLRTNLGTLRSRMAAHPAVSLLEPEGGWAAVLQVPATSPEETLVLRLVEDAGVIVHPGYFFDFAAEAFLVISLLPAPAVFADAVDRLLPIASGASR
jgi:alanine-synthesizing transaminase